MRADLSARLRRIMRGGSLPKSPVTPETPVTGPSGYRSKPQRLQALQPLQVENRKLKKCVFSPATSPVPLAPEADEVAILERAGLCANSVPAIYLDAWARLNCIMPLLVSEAQWRQALDDGGRFLDAWGWACGSGWQWSAEELFLIPRATGGGGLIWRLGGALVEVYGPERVRLSDGRTIKREVFGGEQS